MLTSPISWDSKLRVNTACPVEPDDDFGWIFAHVCNDFLQDRAQDPFLELGTGHGAVPDRIEIATKGQQSTTFFGRYFILYRSGLGQSCLDLGHVLES